MKALIAVVIVLAALPSQAQDDPTPIDSGIEERVEVRVVEFSIVATDEQRRPVTDLGLGDLRVRAGGKERRIAYVDRAIEAPGSSTLPTVALSLKIPNNAPSARVESPGPRRYYIIFVDVENDARHERSLAAMQLADFVGRDLGPNDLVSVVSYDGELNVEAPFTDDRDAVRAALDRAYGRPMRAGISTEQLLDDLLARLPDCRAPSRRQGFKKFDELCVRERLSTYMEQIRPDIENYYERLDDLVAYASGLRGQVTVFAVTHGKTYQPGYEFIEAVQAIFGFTNQATRLQGAVLARGAMLRATAERVIEQALRRNVVLYVLDRSASPASRGAEQGTPWEPGARPYHVAWLQAQQDVAALALDSGGSVLRHLDLTEAASKALDREKGRYRVGIYTDRWLTERELRRVDVKSPRPGVRIEAGRGSYTPGEADKVLEGGIELRAPARSAVRPDSVVVPFLLEFDPRRLGYQPADDVYRAGLTLHLVMETKHGDRLAEVYHFFTHEYDAALWQEGRVQRLALPGAVEAPAGEYALIAKVHNPLVGVGGQIVTAVDISVEGRPGQGH